MDEELNQNTLRDEIERQFDAVEAAPTEQTDAQNTNEATITPRERDEQGRFSTKTAMVPEQQHSLEDELPRPKGWKKDYVPIWDKMYKGEALTPEETKQVALYANQRESEYATGVSTYKTEAERVKAWDAAVQPMLPRLQQFGVDPTQYVSGLVNADNVLTNGSTQQKIQIFSQLAQSYGIPLSVIGQAAQSNGQVNPVVDDLLREISQLKNQVTQVSAWRDQQESSSVQSIIDSFKNSKEAPHFEAVKPMIAQLLESGVATDLKDAYQKAIRLDDGIWQLEQGRQREVADKAAAAEKARSLAVGVKTITPRGNTGANVDTSSIRSAISAAMEQHNY